MRRLKLPERRVIISQTLETIRFLRIQSSGIGRYVDIMVESGLFYYVCTEYSRYQVTIMPQRNISDSSYRGADKSSVRPGRKQVTATEDFELHILYL